MGSVTFLKLSAGGLMSDISEKIKGEIRELIPPTIFFLIIFHIVAFMRALMQKSYGIEVTDMALATIGALIVAKAILIAEKLPFMKTLEGKPLLHIVLWKTLIFSLFTFLFRLVEELVPLLAKHGSFGSAVSHLFEEIVWPRFLATQILLFMALILYCSAAELIRVLGKERVKEIFLGQEG
jgi:hypothetical protein